MEDEKLEAVLEAGTYAATGHGTQSPRMVVVRDAALLKCLGKLNAQVWGKEMDPFYGAPVAVFVMADKEAPTGIQDACLVMGNLMLEQPGQRNVRTAGRGGSTLQLGD